LVVQIPTQVGELFVVELEDVKAIEDQGGMRQVRRHGVDVGRRHVGGHGLDLGPTGAEPPPESQQRITAFSPAHVENRAAFEVQDDGHVLVALAGGNLVDGDLLDVLEPRLVESPLEGLLLDFLDHVPTDAQVTSHVLDGHVPRQFQDVALKRPAVGPSRLGETDGRLANQAAVLAGQPRDPGLQLHPLGAERHGPKPPHDHPMTPHVLRTTGAQRHVSGFRSITNTTPPATYRALMYR